jgi:FAD/FMN-containing dehydrogenase
MKLEQLPGEPEAVQGATNDVRHRPTPSMVIERAVSKSPSHEQKVAHIVKQLVAARGVRPLSLRKKTVAHQVPKAGDLRHRDAKIDVSALTSILEIDPVRRICVAESGVTFIDLVRATLKHGLVPIVVPELTTITIGGAVSGCSIESMSFVRGGFHDTCREYEVITATGEVLRCTPDNEHKLVFEMMHNSFGTLGILSKLTFELVPAQPYVHITYETYRTLDDYRAAIWQHYETRDADFMDGMIHAKDCFVLCMGRFVASAPYTSNYEWMKIYYVSTRKRREDYMTTVDYFFRYDRGVTNVRPTSLIGRALFGRFLSSTQWLQIGNKLNFLLARDRPTVTVDVFVPFSKIGKFMEWYEPNVDFYPIWVVPYKRVNDYPWLADSYWHALEDSLFVDLAIYGMRQPPGRNIHRELEEQLAAVGGLKTLISHNYYSRDEFWALYNKPNYDAVKRVTDPDNQFRDVYDKMCVAAMGRVQNTNG